MTTCPGTASFARRGRIVRSDWPELEYLVIGTGVKVLHANEAAASVAAAVQALNEARSALPNEPTAADLSKLADRYVAQAAPVEAAATTLETEMPAIAPGQSRILDIMYDDHDAAGVAEEYLGGAVGLGAAAANLREVLTTFLRSLETLGRSSPELEDKTADLASAMRRVVIALEPASEWADRSAAILADWT